MTCDKLPDHYAKRYKATTYSALVARVCAAIARTPKDEGEFYAELAAKTFIPAGNTLLAGADETIAPNCCVIGMLSDDNLADKKEMASRLWKAKTGVGVNLSGLADPVAALRQLSDINHSINLGHRPSRGNMAVLNASHPKIKDFIFCKMAKDNTITNFNISVAVEPAAFRGRLAEWISKAAWQSGDPGLVVLSRGARYGPNDARDIDPGIEPIVTCVPCGEQFMHANETCNLGSINLNAEALMCKPNNGELDHVLLEHAVRVGVRFLDTVVDRLSFVDAHMRETSKRMRRIGLGVMGWADYLKRINISYASEEALRLAERLSATITEIAEDESRRLAEKYGAAVAGGRYRNISVTCIAPTGGITGLTENVGYAIEPAFAEALSYDYKTHIAMQEAWQSGMHNAVSKTVNLPASATVELVRAVFEEALRSQCKGITIYRDTCNVAQPKELGSCAVCVE